MVENIRFGLDTQSYKYAPRFLILERIILCPLLLDADLPAGPGDPEGDADGAEEEEDPVHTEV